MRPRTLNHTDLANTISANLHLSNREIATLAGVSESTIRRIKASMCNQSLREIVSLPARTHTYTPPTIAKPEVPKTTCGDTELDTALWLASLAKKKSPPHKGEGGALRRRRRPLMPTEGSGRIG